LIIWSGADAQFPDFRGWTVSEPLSRRNAEGYLTGDHCWATETDNHTYNPQEIYYVTCQFEIRQLIYRTQGIRSSVDP
jgi:hypothetical protein